MFHLRTCLRQYARAGLWSGEALKPALGVVPRPYSTWSTWGDRYGGCVELNFNVARPVMVGFCWILKIGCGDWCKSWTRRVDENQCLEAHHRFAGKVMVVTGGASGIGEATARLFVEQGGSVVIADINSEKGSQVAEDLGDRARFIHCDVRSEPDVAALVDAAASWKGKLDVYHSNAGFVGALGSIEELDLRDFDETVAVNLRGAVLGIKHAARVMKPANHGAIVCTGSTASVMAGLGPHTYCLTKTALRALVTSTALELRSFGIRVNMVSPDATATPMFQRVMEDSTGLPHTMEQTEARMAQKALLPNRPLTCADVAHAVLFLSCDDAGYISGHNLLLDAARTVGLPIPPGFHHWFAGHSPILR